MIASDLAAVSQSMICFGRDVNVLAFFQLQFPVAAHHIATPSTTTQCSPRANVAAS